MGPVTDKMRMIMPEYLKFNFVKQLMPDSIYQRLRRAILFAPDDPNNLHQTVPQRHIEGLNVERIKGYRYPAPGSRFGAKVPSRENSDQLYDTNYAPRDPRNLDEGYSVTVNSTNPMLLDSSPIRTGASPGNKNPAVLAYDPTGLRSSASATWEELDKAVIKNATPDHLPVAEWELHLEEIGADCDRKGIPYTTGRRYKYETISANYNTLRW